MFGLPERNGGWDGGADATVAQIMHLGGYGMALLGFVLTVVGFASQTAAFRMPDYSGGVFQPRSEIERQTDETPEPARYGWCAVVGLPMMGGGVLMLRQGYVRDMMRKPMRQAEAMMQKATDDMIVVTDDGVGVRCSACGASNRQGSRYCDQCGKPLGIACSCGQSNQIGAKFCDRCGKALG